MKKLHLFASGFNTPGRGSSLIRRILSALVLALVLAGCTPAELGRTETGHSLTLMTWNVHNLFDGKDDGYEYAEYRQSAGWSEEKYKGRLNTISAAIGTLPVLPDVIVLQEIESLQVLKDLAVVLPRGYNWSHFANNPRAATGVGVISRLSIQDEKAHSINIDSDTIPRPVLEVRIQTEEDTPGFIIFACHWKSKIGGADETESIRKASARVILRRIRELQKTESETGIIIAGDLNINHDDFIRRGSNLICALLPDSQRSASLVQEQNDFIVISGNRPPVPVYFSDETIVLYSPWVNELENGTYYYRNNWETIDHFLVSHQFFNDTGWEYSKTIVLDFEPFAGSNWRPVPYNPRTGYGLSDHLPLLLTLRKNTSTINFIR